MVASPMARLSQHHAPAIQSGFLDPVPAVYAFLASRRAWRDSCNAAEMSHSRFLDVDLTEGAIRVRQGSRVLTITPTPPPPNAGDAPDFIIHLDDIETWDAPDNEVEIEVAELQMILHAVEAECERHGLSIEFE
jgi:hypothetical protein